MAVIWWARALARHRGKRKVTSAYVEFAVPVISPEWASPARNVELQLAGRFEDYSDLGNVSKPKVALAWDLVDGVRLRGSMAQGFKAPNLEVINASIITRANTRTDWVRCRGRPTRQADHQLQRLLPFTERLGPAVRQSGSEAGKLQESYGFGLVLQPKFIPSEFGDFTFTADFWDVKQKGIVGLFGEGNALIADYLARTTGGSNPNVVRAAATADDTAAFAGTGLTPVGTVLYVKDQYVNLLPQEARGIDYALNWSLKGTPYGNFER